MGLEDREWYRNEVKDRAKREGASDTRRKSNDHNDLSSTSQRLGLSISGVGAILLFACVVAVGRDMKDRGVPITWQGFKWWLSLWFGA